MMSIDIGTPVKIICHLIEGGYNVNDTNNEGLTALHLAIKRGHVDITHELIKRGANLEARTPNERFSPLCIAVWELCNHFWSGIKENRAGIEILCMLLHYGANVDTLNEHGVSALTLALQKECPQAASLMIPYYEEPIYNHYEVKSPICYAIEFEQYAMAFQLLETDVDINHIAYDGHCTLTRTLLVQNGILLFKRIWPKMNYHTLLNLRLGKPFLLYFLMETYTWGASIDRVEGLLLIIECPIIYDLVEELIEYADCNYLRGFFENRMVDLIEANANLSDRMSIVSFFLTAGIKVTVNDVSAAIQLFGVGPEFEALVYAADAVNENCIDGSFPCHPLLLVILAQEDFDINKVTKAIKTFIVCHSLFPTREKLEETMVNLLKFFSIPYAIKMEIISHAESFMSTAIINSAPEFPSLVELSRNRVHKLLRQTHKITKPYHYLDIVKNLSVPQTIKDQILFKKPLY